MLKQKSTSPISLTRPHVFTLLNTKEDKNMGNQTVDGSINYKHSSKYLLLCSAEERHSYRFGTTWGWV